MGQVDCKFIACMLEGSTLILIDQHAADERVRVERFLKELCLAFLDYDHEESSPVTEPASDTVELDPPVPVLLTHREAAQIVKSKETKKVFERWGVEFVGLDQVVLGREEGEEEEEEDLDVLRLWQPKRKSVRAVEDVGRDETGSGYTQVKVKSVPALLRDKVSMNYYYFVVTASLMEAMNSSL